MAEEGSSSSEPRSGKTESLSESLCKKKTSLLSFPSKYQASLGKYSLFGSFSPVQVL